MSIKMTMMGLALICGLSSVVTARADETHCDAEALAALKHSLRRATHQDPNSTRFSITSLGGALLGDGIFGEEVHVFSVIDHLKNRTSGYNVQMSVDSPDAGCAAESEIDVRAFVVLK